MQVIPTEIPEVLVIIPRKHDDARGFFSETYNAARVAEHGVKMTFVQDNHARSVQKHTLRGVHFQRPPKAQDKLVRVAHGAVLDVAVDLRRDSPTFGRWISRVLSEENWEQLLIPKGFGHGLLTLEPDTHVLYKVSEFFSPEHDAGVRWDDPQLSIDWGVSEDQVILSDKDASLPTIADSPRLF